MVANNTLASEHQHKKMLFISFANTLSNEQKKKFWEILCHNTDSENLEFMKEYVNILINRN